MWLKRKRTTKEVEIYVTCQLLVDFLLGSLLWLAFPANAHTDLTPSLVEFMLMYLSCL